MAAIPVRAAVWACAPVACAFVIAYGPVLAGLWRDWLSDDNYAHGLLVVPIALYFAWLRRERLAALPLQPSAAGGLFVLGGLALLLVGTAGIEFFLMRVSILPVLAGIVVFVAGWAHLRVLAFPIAFLILMIPLPALVFNQIAFPLQLVATRVGVSALEALAIPVLREGNVIILATTTLEVAEACSGIRSLMSLTTVAVVLGCLGDDRRWSRALLVASAVPVAIAANGARVAGVGVIAHVYGTEAATGFLHGFSGWLLFAVSLVMLLALSRVLGAVMPTAAAARPEWAVTR
jgi:exosortase